MLGHTPLRLLRRPRGSVSSDESDDSLPANKDGKGKSILHRSSSTLTKGSIGGKSAKSVKFVEIPAVCHEYDDEDDDDSYDFEKCRVDDDVKRKPSLWSRIRRVPAGKDTPKEVQRERPVISGPYRLNCSSPSLLLTSREKGDTDRDSVRSMGRHRSREEGQSCSRKWLGLGFGRIIFKFGWER
jgi:hypothetical protein